MHVSYCTKWKPALYMYMHVGYCTKWKPALYMYMHVNYCTKWKTALYMYMHVSYCTKWKTENHNLQMFTPMTKIYILYRVFKDKMSRLMTKTMKWHVRPASAQSDQSLAVHMKKAWVLSYPLSAQRRLIRLGGCPGRSESLLGARSFCKFCHEAAQISFNRH